MIICQRCGRQETHPNAAFCSHCAAPLFSPPVPPPPAPIAANLDHDPATLARARSRARIVSALLLALLVLGTLDILPILPDPFGHWCSTARLVAGVAAFIAWLRWVSAAYSVLRAMGDRSRRYDDPFWCWLIPLFNLIRPFQVMADLWRRSAIRNRGATLAATVPLPVALIAGWAALVTGILLWLFGSDLTRFLAPQSEVLVSAVDSLRALAPLAASAFAYLVVIGIDQMQCAGSTPLLGLAAFLGWLTPKSVGASIAVLLLASTTGLLGLLTRSPESSLRALAEAFQAHDLDRFNDYFDTKSVIYNEFFEEITDPAKVRGEGPGGIPLTVFRDFNLGVFRRVFAFAGPFVAKNAASLVVTGRPDSWILLLLDSDGTGWLSSPLQGIRTWGTDLAANLGKSYQGVSETRRYGDIAVVKLRIVPLVDGQPMETSITLQMLRVHNHWRVVGRVK